MPLLDHFAADAALQLNGESFHSTWANCIRDALHQVLPPRRFFALVQMHLGTYVAADVAEYDRHPGADAATGNGSDQSGAGAVAVRAWAPPAARVRMPAIFPDDLEVHIYEQRGGARLVAVVELVSPSNKDRPAERRAFAAKCATYLQRGLGVIVADLVTDRPFNLHNELVRLLELDPAFAMPAEETLYATAYRPTHQQDTNLIETWLEPLAVGQSLPVLPLALRGAMTIPLDLEATYNEACERSGL